MDLRGDRDLATFDALFAAYRTRVRRLAARLFGEAYADDVAQEAMLRVYRHFVELDTTRPVWPWLAVVTRNAGIDLVRARGTAVPAEIGTLDELAPPTADLPAAAAVASDTRHRLRAAMRRLTERDRQAIELFEIEGMPVTDVATLCGTTPNAIRQRLFRARRHLAEEYQKLGGHPAAGGPGVAPVPRGDGRAARLAHRIGDAIGSCPPHVAENAAIAIAVATALVVGSPGPPGTSPAPRRRADVVAGAAAAPPPAGPGAGLVTNLPAAVGGGPRRLLRELLGDGDNDAGYRAESLASSDGTPLQARVFFPETHRDGQRHPVLLSAGPYPRPLSGAPRRHHDDLLDAGELLARGYVYTEVSLRGRGGSGGCPDFGGPGEQADVAAAIAWAARQPWSDGWVGVVGGPSADGGTSYDGWAAVAALAADPPELKAVVAWSPFLSFYRGLFLNGVRYRDGLWPARGVASDAAMSVGSNDRPAGDRLDGPLPAACAAGDLAAMQDPDADFWRVRDLVAWARASRVPVLWAHGFGDAVAMPDNALGVPASPAGISRGWLGQYGNTTPAGDRNAEWLDEATRWLRYFVGREPVEIETGAEVQQGDGRWRTVPSWPPAGVTVAMPLLAGTSLSVAAGVWTSGDPLRADAHLAGVPRLSVRTAGSVPGAAVVVRVYDVDEDGRAVLVTRGATLAGDGLIEVALYPQDWTFRRGHRIGVLLGGADDWFTPSGPPANVVEASLALPFLDPPDRSRS